ncbi:MAG: PP2C family protein-serine/threonine phosphatase [Planctomycetota bacterium]|jgi:sigma-B regulation protein RsbU (phosphoserine phosphatase)
MRGTPIIAISHTGETPELRSFLDSIASAWRAPDGFPAVEHVTFEGALQDPEMVDGVAIVFAEGERDSMVYKAVDALEPRMVPMLVVGSDSSPSSTLGRAVLGASMRDEPVVLATVLRTLVSQLPFFNEMHSELRVSQRYQGGLRQEMGRLHEEMQLAGRVQREFLPEVMPSLEGVGFDVLFRPCGYVSGDIYDVKRVDEHRVGFVLADAVGHGVPAALMTMILTRALPSMEKGLEDGSSVEPSTALHRLNEVMIRGGGDNGRFATGVYGIIDVRTHEVTLAGAGHPPPLVIGPDGVRPIETEGPLLGIFHDAEFPQVTFQMEPGELLMLYSDGFETAFPSTSGSDHERKLPSEEYIDHFGSLASVLESGGVERARKRLEEELDAQAGSLHQVDDLTALLVAPMSVGASAGGALSAAA